MTSRNYSGSVVLEGVEVAKAILKHRCNVMRLLLCSAAGSTCSGWWRNQRTPAQNERRLEETQVTWQAKRQHCSSPDLLRGSSSRRISFFVCQEQEAPLVLIDLQTDSLLACNIVVYILNTCVFHQYVIDISSLVFIGDMSAQRLDMHEIAVPMSNALYLRKGQTWNSNQLFNTHINFCYKYSTQRAIFSDSGVFFFIIKTMSICDMRVLAKRCGITMRDNKLMVTVVAPFASSLASPQNIVFDQTKPVKF